LATIKEINNRLNKLSNDFFRTSESLTASFEKNLLAVYARSYVEIEKIVIQLYKRFDELTPAEMAKFNRMLKLRKEILRVTVPLFGESNRIINNAIIGNMDLGYYSNGYSFETTLGINLGFQKVNVEATIANTANDFGFINWKDRNKTNIARYNQNVESTITRGIIQGHGIAKMTRDLRKETVKASRGANRIIRTEAHRAYEAGNMVGLMRVSDSAAVDGISILKFWIATFDDRTREDHGVADGQEQPIDKDFHVGGVYMSAPGLSGDPSQDINCRCTTGRKINNLMPISRREQLTRTKINYMSFADWLRSRKIPAAA
jgi:hypothetical protein